MSKREDIIDPWARREKEYGLVYSEVLGWIDLGHARGADITNCLEQMQRGGAQALGLLWRAGQF